MAPAVGPLGRPQPGQVPVAEACTTPVPDLAAGLVCATAGLTGDSSGGNFGNGSIGSGNFASTSVVSGIGAAPIGSDTFATSCFFGAIDGGGGISLVTEGGSGFWLAALGAV